MTLGDFIYQYRKKYHLSMDDFAKRSGLSKAYISLLEKKINPRSGKPIVPTYETMRKAAKGMNLSMDELFKMIDQDFSIDSGDSDVIKEFEFIAYDVEKMEKATQERLLAYVRAMVEYEKEKEGSKKDA